LKGRVLVAMSGGVDSSVAALLLKAEGYDVAGVTMCLGVKDNHEGRVACCGRDAIEDARKVCQKLKVSHHVFDYSEELKKYVIDRFISDYMQGRTPNPCIECNRHLKFRILLQQALALGFDYLATGHYGRIERDRDGPYLVRPKDREKDQTYFLYTIPIEKLDNILFPLASYTKNQVRMLAMSADLPVALKNESQDICFVTQKNYREFLLEHTEGIKPGPIVDEQERELGEHRGIAYYTVGQRTGLGVSHRFPLYVVSIDAARNLIVVGRKRSLNTRQLAAGELNLLTPQLPGRASAQIRYGSNSSTCTLALDGVHRLNILFDQPISAVTPGQSVVCYSEDRVLGGGIIEKGLT